MTRCLAITVSIAAALLAGAQVCASDRVARTGNWPAFHDGGPLLGVADPIAPPPMRVRWTFRAESDDAAGAKPATQDSGAPPAFEASAAIVDGTVYCADRAGALRAIDLKTGQRKWTYRAEAGFSASPAVLTGSFQVGGRKLSAIVCLGDEDGTFHAIDAQSGQKLWTFDAGSSIHSSANLVQDRVIFGDDGAGIYCLDVVNGKKVWESRAGDRINGAPAIGGAAPGTSPNVYVSGCDAELRAYALDSGKERFHHELGALCPGSPALLPDRIVVGTDGGKVLCLSPDGRRQLWVFDGIQNQAMVYGSPAVSDGIAVVGARDRNVYGLDLATGQKKWVFPTRGDVDSSPVISAGRVYIGSKDKRLYALDLKTGQKLWDFVASRAITATPAIAEGALVIGDTGGNLYCLSGER